MSPKVDCRAFERRGRSHEDCLGWVPRKEDLDWSGLDFSDEQWDELMSVDPQKLRMQALRHEELFLELSEFLPKEMLFEARAFGVASVTFSSTTPFVSKTNDERLKQHAYGNGHVCEFHQYAASSLVFKRGQVHDSFCVKIGFVQDLF